MMSKLNILQFNARSALSNKGSLEYCLQENDIHLALLSETWFRPEQTVKFSGYNVVRQDRGDGKAGVAILIKTTLPFKLLSNIYVIDGLMMVGISIPYKNEILSIISAYNHPNNQIASNEWVRLFNSIPNPKIFACDTNCHSFAWGNSFSDAKGRMLLEAIDDQNLIILNDGSATLINNIYQYNISAPDVTLCSPQIAAQFTWRTLDDGLGSDHYPILINSLSRCISPIKFQCSKIWNLKNADWAKFGVSMGNLSEQRLSEGSVSYSNFRDDLRTACETAIPKYSTKRNSKFNKSWWNEKCAEVTLQRKKALKAYKLNPSFNNYISYKNINALAKKIFKEAKRISWKNYCSSLNKNIPISKVWRKLKIIKNIYQPDHPPISYGPWVETFLNKMAPPFVQNHLIQVTASLSNKDDEDFFLKPFSLAELNMAMKSSKNTAPGNDNVYYEMLNNLPENSKIFLLKLLNKSWLENNFPEDWRQYIIIPLLKEGKDGDNADSYRPIALSSCVFKTLERLIKNRMEWFLESKFKLPASQFGFRRNRSTSDAQAQLIFDIYDAFSKNKTLLGLFLDIRGAYDNVQLPILSQKMSSLGLPLKFTERVLSLLNERSISLRVNGTIVGTRTTQIGLPQGSILSPILYTVYVADLESVLPQGVKIVQYADDICLYATRISLTECQEALDSAMQAVDKWSDLNGLTISESKSVACPFSRTRQPNIPTEIRLGRNLIPCDIKVKFLGLLLDRKLNWKGHINQVVTKVEKYLNVLRAICSVKWGADPNICLLFYRATIRSVIDYGCVFYGQARKSHLRSLDVLHQKSLRISLGFLKSTPIDVILAEANEPPLQVRRSLLSDKYILKLMSSESDLLRKICNVSITVLTSVFWNKKVSPPLVDSFINNANLQNQIFASSSHPFFNKNFEIIQINLNTYLLGDFSELPSFIRNQHFLAEIRSRWPMSRLIFTDGSKIEENVGCAFYDLNAKLFKSFKLPNGTSVFSAESVALLKALKYSNDVPEQNIVIITDARSLVVQLGNIKLKNLKNYLLLEILSIHSELTVAGKKITLLWIAGHQGIEGNEKADLFAKEGAMNGQLLQMKIPASDLTQLIKAKALAEWQISFTRGINGMFYKSIQPIINRRPWYTNSQGSRDLFVQIFRLRSNHYVCGAYLNKIGMKSTPHCTICNVPEDMEHVLMICPRFDIERNVIWEDFYRNTKIPFNYRCLLQEVAAYPAIHSFLKATEKMRLTDA